jgi:hypothetical protein
VGGTALDPGLAAPLEAKEAINSPSVGAGRGGGGQWNGSGFDSGLSVDWQWMKQGRLGMIAEWRRSMRITQLEMMASGHPIDPIPRHRFPPSGAIWTPLQLGTSSLEHRGRSGRSG